MDLINNVEKFIFASKTWQFIVVVMSLSLIKTGVWYIPNIEASRTLAQNPFTNLLADHPMAHYLFWNWLASFLAWLIGVTEKWPFFLFYLFFSFAFSAFVLFNLLRISQELSDLSRISIILFVMLPVSTTSYFWVSNDSLTLFIMILTLTFSKIYIFAFMGGGTPWYATF